MLPVLLDVRASRASPESSCGLETFPKKLFNLNLAPPLSKKPLLRFSSAKALSKKAGLWSVEWKTRAARWLGHLKRHPESPGGKVLAYHNMQWLRDRRAELLKRKKPKSLQYSLFSGWTDSRVLRGRPSPRFEEAVDASRTR